MTLLDDLFLAMIEYDKNDPKRIQHFTKVHAYAALIGKGEGLSEKDQLTLEAAAYVHDIGIHPSEEKYGYETGKTQEELGPAEAEKLLRNLHFDEEVIARVSYLVGHHHTYDNIDGLDYQILVEADFLVNLFENGDQNADRATEEMKKAAESTKEKIFRTKTGTRILEEMFGI